MSEKQLQQPKRWLVPFPEKKAVTGHPCQDTCNGNQKMGQLLHYFLCEASWELERQDLPESCKVVKFTRSHDHILKRVKISEKTLIQFLKQFNAWEFILSESYGKEFTVQAEPIRDAMYNPVFTKKVRRKSCTSTSENTTTSHAPGEAVESCKVYFLQENPEALRDLQLYNIALEAKIQALSEALEQESCKVVKLQEKVEASKLYNSTLSTWCDAVSQALKIPSPIDSVIDRDLRDSNKESNSVLSDDEHAHSLSQNNENDYHSYSTPAIASSALTTRNEEGVPDHAQPLPSLPAANHPDRGSADVPGDSQMDSTGVPGTLDAPSVGGTQGSDAYGGEGQRGVAEDTTRGIGSRAARETGTARNTARGQITEGDDHAHLPSGSALWDGALPASRDDRNVPAVDDRQVAAPATRPVLEAGQKEIDTEGDDHGLVDMDAARLGQHSGAGDVLHRVWADVRADEVRGTERERAGRDIEQTASREDVPAVAASPLPSSTVEPGESGEDTLLVAPVHGQAAPVQQSAQQGDDMFNQPQMHVLVTSQQFTSVEEWEQGRDDFMETLRHAWKTASSDFKQQFGNWYGYRKHYVDRWEKANPKPADVLPLEVQRILDDWKSLHRKVIPVTKSDIDAATMLAPCNPTREELSTCRKWHFATDDPKKPWYRKIGVSLMDVANHWSKWQSLQDADDSRGETKTTTRTLTREELKRMPV